MLERWMTSAAKIGYEDLLGYGFYDTAVMIGPGKKTSISINGNQL